jgi:membrane associated rhomboid family serine protease
MEEEDGAAVIREQVRPARPVSARGVAAVEQGARPVSARGVAAVERPVSSRGVDASGASRDSVAPERPVSARGAEASARLRGGDVSLAVMSGGPESPSVEDGDVISPKAYQRLLRAASSYASFQLAGEAGEAGGPAPRAGWCGGACNTGKPVVCAAIILTCGVLMVVEIGANRWRLEPLSSNPMLGPSVDVLLRLGAKRTDLIVDKGEWWRLIAPVFLHGGLLHYLFNMLGIWSIGFPLERQFGSAVVLYIFLLSGFMGVVMSAIFNPSVVGIGASGGIFGIFGASWSELIQNWSLYQGQGCKSLLQLTVVTLFNLALGLMPFLDNFAHIGGLLTGFFCGFGVLVSNRYSYYGELKRRKTYQVVLQICSVIITPLFVVAGLFLLYYGVGGGLPASQWCPACKYLSCVPFPPGDNPWWTCDACSDSGVKADVFNTTTTRIHCPDQTLRFIDTPADLETNLLAICRQVCYARR